MVPFSARRESDGPADELYTRLLRTKKGRDDNFMPAWEFEDLISQRKLFSLYDEVSSC